MAAARQISAILVAGKMRARGQRVLDAPCAHTIAAELTCIDFEIEKSA